MLKPMVVWALAVESATNNPVVILKELDGERTVPIWIGLLEAAAIATELGGIKLSSRPMTHDLLKNIIELMEARVEKVEICDLRNSTYYALIHLNYNGKQIPIDARPSDALALSLRFNAPIFAVEEVIRKARQVDLKKDSVDSSSKEDGWRDALEHLDPEDFGKYKM